ncbi:MAG: ATP-binding protein [Vulcanimicrobiaceae bacterium]
MSSSAQPSPSYHATFTSEPRNVSLARNAIAKFAGMCGFDDESVGEIRLAVGEALSNACEHGRSQRNAAFSVLCLFENGQLTVSVQDSGEGFIEPAHTGTCGPDERGRGFGLFIMRQLMHSVSFARNGTHVQLTRRIEP